MAEYLTGGLIGALGAGIIFCLLLVAGALSRNSRTVIRPHHHEHKKRALFYDVCHSCFYVTPRD